MDKKEKWAEDVLNVLDNVEQVEPKPELFNKINRQLFETRQVKIIPLKQVKLVAAAACLVFAVNVYVFASNIKSNQITKTTERQDLLTEYTLYK